MGVHEPKYSSTLPSDHFATGIHLTSAIENELGQAILPSSNRTGYLGYEMITAMEPLFYQYGVDLVRKAVNLFNVGSKLCDPGLAGWKLVFTPQSLRTG